MGSEQSKNRVKAWQDISENRLAKKDIKRYRKIWVEMFGENGEMDKDGFRKWIKAIEMFPQLDEDAPIDVLFRSYDRDRNGRISFEEFIIYLSITAPTETEQDPTKIIEVTFMLYDENGDGKLTAKELKNGMRDTFRLLGHETQSPKFDHVIDSRVDQLMEFADENGDGEITLDEIKNAVKKHPQLLLIF